MALQTVPAFIGQSGYQHPVELFRNLVGSLTGNGKGLVGANTGFALTPSGSAMQMTVAAGAAVIDGNESTSQGSYYVWSPSSEVLAWPAASAQPRIDSLILRVIDTQYGSDASSPQALWQIVQGTPSGSPSAQPDIEFEAGGDFHRPGAWWRMANVLVEAADTNMAATTITDLRVMANARELRVDRGLLLKEVVRFTASGTFTKANYPGATKVRVMVQGGGGAGGGGGATAAGQVSAVGGGQGGAYAESILDVASLASSVTVTVGAGGTGAAGAAGGNGNTSSFGAHVSAAGGSGGPFGGAGNTNFGQPGGSGSQSMTGDIQIGGQAGIWGARLGTVTGQVIIGNGGSSRLGGGGHGEVGSVGANGVGYGGGGGGGGCNPTSVARAGGNGAPGIVIIEVYV
jgi:hypothetical protein